MQWNCRGFRANYEELGLLVQKYNPKVICLQETFLPIDSTTTLKNYTAYHNRSTSILIHNSVHHTPISLNTPLAATAIRVTLHKVVTICSIYLPPKQIIQLSDLDTVLSQLPSPNILLGDLNGANRLWGSTSNNPRGDLIETFLTNNNLCLFNDKSSTFLHSGHGTFSCIDLSISEPSLFLDYEWSVEGDLHGSDHFPIILRNTQPDTTQNPPKWKMSKADWTHFESLCLEKLTTLPINDTAIDDFTTTISYIADQCIPKTSGKSIARRNPWFNDGCKEAIAKRKRDLRHFKHEPTSNNLDTFKISRAKARRTVRQARKNSWRDYVSRLNHRTSPKSV
ncbi:endonuclease/exonuclease/phosphatase family protein [Solemya elarraichensis gill symbiont]|uniref:endonuclease/exonuclease/phosphatase family protein n=1 Tax=Solemya elarraichensis gill symbiont TaxID=1918949 RepID=UPI001FE3B66C|nr:endonuclease/exonuclease/phosphatase family protein [Solemya elarraichensis gill symbiont]